MIIGFLSKDLPSLCAAGLVCRAWAVSSRRTMFRSVLLTLNNLDKMRIAQFFKLLDRRRSFMRGHIRSVEFGLRSGSHYFKYPFPYSPNLATVTHLTVGRVDLIDDLLLSLSRTFTTIISLKINDTVVERLSNFVSFLTSFTSLEELTIHNVRTWSSWAEGFILPAQAVLSKKLRFISASTRGSFELFNIMFSVGLPVPAIETLHMGDIRDTDDVVQSVAFFKSLERTVRSLSLELRSVMGLSTSSNS